MGFLGCVLRSVISHFALMGFYCRTFGHVDRCAQYLVSDALSHCFSLFFHLSILFVPLLFRFSLRFRYFRIFFFISVVSLLLLLVL